MHYATLKKKNTSKTKQTHRNLKPIWLEVTSGLGHQFVGIVRPSLFGDVSQIKSYTSQTWVASHVFTFAPANTGVKQIKKSQLHQ